MSARDFLASKRLAAALRGLVESAETVATGLIEEDDLADLYEQVELARDVLADYDLELVRPSKPARREIANIIADCDRILDREHTR